MYVDLPDFHKTYFGSVPNLATTSKMFFDDCLEGSSLFFDGGWRGWPEGAKQDAVLSWFADFSDKLAAFAGRHESTPDLLEPTVNITSFIVEVRLVAVEPLYCLLCFPGTNWWC